MYWLPKGWIPWYGEWVLAFPYAPRGSVSVQVWQMACGSVLAMVVEAVKSLVLLALGKANETKQSENAQKEQPEPMNFAS
jgi:tail-anchored protein insertion receptor